MKLKTGIFLTISTLCTLFTLMVIAIFLFFSVFFTKQRFEILLSTMLQTNVTIGHIDHSISTSQLDLTLDNLSISSTNDPKTAITIAKLHTTIDLWKSLLHLYPVTQTITINGLSASINVQPTTTLGTPKGDSLKDDLKKLLLQSDISLKNSKITLHKDAQTTTLSSINVRFQKLNSQLYQLTATAKGNTLQSLILKATLISEPLHGIDGTIYLALNKFNFKAYGVLLPKDLTITHGLGNIQTWLTLSKGKLIKAQSQFSLNDFVLTNSHTQRQVNIKHLSENLMWKPRRSGGEITIQPFHIIPHQPLSLITKNHILLTYQTYLKETYVKLHLGQIHLPTLSHILQAAPFSPKNLVLALDKMQPAGELDNVFAEVIYTHHTFQPLIIDSDINALNIHHYKMIPQVSGIDAHLHLTPTWGELKISGDQMILGKNTIFNHTWPKTKLQAHIAWQKTAGIWDISLKNSSASNTRIHFHAYGIAKYSPHFKKPIIHIIADTQIKNTQDVLATYMPSKIIKPNLNKWLLTNITRAPTANANMLLSGPMIHMPFMAHQGVFELTLNVKDAAVIPWYDWPPITHANTDLFFHNEAFHLVANQGQMLGATLTSGQLDILDMRKGIPTDFIVNLAAKSTAAAAKNVILHSPLINSFRHTLKRMDIKGALRLSLHMRFPLKRKIKRPDITGHLTFHHNRLLVLPLNLQLNDLVGSIRFDHLAIFGNNLSATLWTQPLTININTTTAKSPPFALTKVITLKGRLNLDQILQLHKPYLPLTRFIQGEIALMTTINVHPSYTSVNIRSSLDGLSLLLPAPLYKTAITTLAFHFSTTIFDAQPQIKYHLSLGKILSINAEHMLRNDKKTTGLKAVVAFGQTISGPLPTKGIRLTGNIPYLSISDWQHVILQLKAMRLTPASSPANLQSYFSLLAPSNLNIQMLEVYQQQFPATKIGVIQKNHSTLITFNGTKAVGTVTLPNNLDHITFNADFNTLYVTTTHKRTQSFDLPLSQLRAIPPLEITIKHLYINNGLLGALTLKTTPSPEGLLVNTFNMQGKTLSSQLRGTITKANKTTQVNIAGKLTSNDWGKVLKQLGFPGILSKGDGNIKLVLKWADTLWPIKMNTLNGHLNLKINNGALTKVNPGFARLLGIFSVSSIFRRLKMNFNDLVTQGLAFDQLKSKFSIQNGVASTQDFNLSGPGVNFTMKGIIDFNKKTLDQTIVAVPNLEGGIALGAGIFGGPIAGVAAWFAEKILSNTLLKGKGVAYRMKGPFANPKVTKIR